MQDAIILHLLAPPLAGWASNGTKMGWLRDFMSAAEPPIPSFGQLAQRCLDHKQWPPHSRPKYRSLSTLFSKLDHGTDLDWLRERMEVQQVLAQLLDRPLADIRSAIGETAVFSDSRFVRLVDVRYARELDLVREPLPPGIPSIAFDPPSWSGTFWLAPSGSGRSLTAAWLRARGLAHTALIESREDLARLPPRGPLFLEIASSVDIKGLGLTRADFEAARVFVRPTLITGDFCDPDWGLRKVTSPAPIDYLPELVDWVAARLDNDAGQFHPERVETWMRKVAIPAGAVSVFGDALGLLGMADEIPPRSLLAKSLDELGAHFVERRLREVSDDVNLSTRLIDGAFDALSASAARILVSGNDSLKSPHSLGEWTSLLAHEAEENAPDPQWFVAALEGPLGAQISKRDLRRAARKLPPSAFQLTRALESARLLVPERTISPHAATEDSRALRPTWLASLLSARASQEVIRFAPTLWGQVLLMGQNADLVVNELRRAFVRENFDACFDLLENYEANSPALSAALQGCIVACGLASLEGVEIPEEVVSGLFALQSQEMLVLDKLPEPHLTCDLAAVRLFTRQAFLVGFLALCGEVPFPLVHLDPLRAAREDLRAHFSSACYALSTETWPSVELRAGLLTSMDALYFDRDDHLPPAVHATRHWHLATPSDIQQALTHFPAEAFLLVATQRGASDSDAHRALWRYAASIRSPGSLFLSEETERTFWRHIPLETLTLRVKDGKSVLWDALLPHQFAEWFSSEGLPPLPEEAAKQCPTERALIALSEQGTSIFDDAGLASFIWRAKGALGPLIKRWCRESQEAELVRALTHTPKGASVYIAQALPPPGEVLSLRPTLVHAIRTFLLRAVRERHAQFDECYRLLIAIEKGVGPLRQLSQ